jgi:hypothetical protein
MSNWESLERFLRTDPLDAGCAETFELLDRYVERQLAYGDAAARYPEIAAHLSGCNPCVHDNLPQGKREIESVTIRSSAYQNENQESEKERLQRTRGKPPDMPVEAKVNSGKYTNSD